jgi:hypothetical protein
VAALLLAVVQLHGQEDVFRADFEDGRAPGAEPRLVCSEGIAGEIVPGAGEQGKCLRLSTSAPSGYCTVEIRVPFRIGRNLTLEFDHRSEIEAGFEGAYLGVSLYDPAGKQILWTSDTFSPQWRHACIVIPTLPGMRGADVPIGQEIGRIQLYGRVRDTTDEKGATRCRVQVWFDNIRLYAPDTLAVPGRAEAYVCHNNPPLLDWAGPSAPGTPLQLSRDPGFPDAATTSVKVETSRPFYVPPEPLAAGTWYFRVQQETERVRGWSVTQPVEVPERTHTYRLKPIDFTALRTAVRPRLRRRIRPGGEPVEAAEREILLKQARDAVARGVPEHPGPHVPGDPRWPLWIDWYGKVADGVTARTGSTLRTAGQAAILSGEAEAIQAARTLLLAACAWDPDGGSAARYGDLQAAGLLQGMLWCYDGCESELPAAELATVRGLLHRRVLQFSGHLSPFRMNPAQNHPWRQTTAVAEAALVLAGVFPEADEWLDTACHAFAYRILPSMGFDGENQEGIMYWDYGVAMLADFADLLRFMAGVDLYDHPWLARTCRFPLYTTPPGGYAVSFADNSDKGNACIKGPAGSALVGLLGERVRDPYALWYADRPVAGVEMKPPADLPQSVFYPYIGYAVFNTCLSDGLENVAVGLRCGPYYAGHQHDDNNAFVIHAYGDKLAVDGGYYDWYGSPHFKGYSIRTLAHNTLLVDGKGQVRETSGRLAETFDSPGCGWTVGDASNPAIYAGRLRRFDRRLLFLKPGIVVVHDVVETAGKPARLEWLVHAHTDQAFPCDSAAGSFLIERPAAALQGQFLAPAGVELKVSKSFDIVPQQKRASIDLPWSEVQPEWTLTAAPAAAATQGEFLAVMAVHRRTADAPVAALPIRAIETPVARGCEVRTTYGRWLVLFRRGDAPPAAGLEAEGLQSDGLAAAVLLGADGKVLNAFAAAATRLSWAGQSLFASATPRSWALDEGRGPVPASASRLVFGGETRPLAGVQQALPDGNVGVWWANLDRPELTRCDIEVQGWTGARPPHVRAGGATFTGARGEIALRQGVTCLTVSGQGSLEQVVLTPRSERFIPAEVMPKGFAPEAAAIALEADRPSAESERKGRVQDKVGATGGTAYCQIDGPVQWAEWTFDVPTAGRYELLLRSAGEHPVVRRELRLDGQTFPAERVAVQMVGTGGWCRTTDDWAWFRVLGLDGVPATASLAAGRHVLRLDFIQGSQNLDLFALRRVGE